MANSRSRVDQSHQTLKHFTTPAPKQDLPRPPPLPVRPTLTCHEARPGQCQRVACLARQEYSAPTRHGMLLCSFSLSLSLCLSVSPSFRWPPNKIHSRLQPAAELLKTGHAVECDAVSRQNHISAFSVTSSRAAFPPRTFLRSGFTGRNQPHLRTMTTLGTSLTRNPGAYVAQRHSCHTHVEIQAHTIDTSLSARPFKDWGRTHRRTFWPLHVSQP